MMQNIIQACFVILLTTGLTGCESDENSRATETSPTVSSTLTLGGTKNESAQSVVETTDGGYAVLGYTQSMDGDIQNKSNDSFNFWLIKFNALGEEQWQKNYGGTNDDRGHSIITTNDGGYAILGSSKSSDGNVSSNAGYNDFWMLKLNATGNISWEKSFGYSGADSAFSIAQTNDGGYILSGVLDVTASNGEGNNRLMQRHAGGDYWVIKINTSGELVWSRYFGGTFTDTAYGVVEAADGSIIVVGSSDSNDVDINNNKGSYDFWIVKLSNEGELLWEKSYGGNEIDEARALTKTSDGNFIVVGDTRSNDQDVSQNNGAADIWAIKINTDGVILWEKTYGGSGFDGVQSIHKSQNNAYIIVGNSRSSDGNLNKNNGQNDAWIFNINSDGQMQWQTSIGGSQVELLMDATTLNNGTIIAVGKSNSSDLDINQNKGFDDALIIRLTQ